MFTQEGNTQQKNTYFINAESAAEMNRLTIQDHLLTQEMGGLLPKDINPSGISKVLDLACGPGGWVLDLASAYRHMEVVGVDLSEKMIAHANSRKWPNTSFRVMNILQFLDFPDSTFDFVNIRLIFSFMTRDAWPKLLSECMRILRPGGTLRLTECERPLSNSAALEQWGDWMGQALQSVGVSFYLNERQVGITLMLSSLLQDAGCQSIKHMSFAIDFSAGGDAQGYMRDNSQLGFLLSRPFLLRMIPSITEEDLIRTSTQAMKDMELPHFRAVWYYLSAWGSKPL